MKSSTNGDNKVAQPTVDFRKIPYDKGSEWTTEWFEDFAKYVRMLPEGLLKKQMVSVLDKGVNYTPKFRTLDAVMKEYNITDPEHGKVWSGLRRGPCTGTPFSVKSTSMSRSSG